jgi:uncharacterized membrane protein YtjA (UPF0391 family)
MLWWSMIFFVLALVAGAVGFTMTGAGSVTAMVFQAGCICFLVFAIMLMVMGLTSKRLW